MNVHAEQLYVHVNQCLQILNLASLMCAVQYEWKRHILVMVHNKPCRKISGVKSTVHNNVLPFCKVPRKVFILAPTVYKTAARDFGFFCGFVCSGILSIVLYRKKFEEISCIKSILNKTFVNCIYFKSGSPSQLFPQNFLRLVGKSWAKVSDKRQSLWTLLCLYYG